MRFLSTCLHILSNGEDGLALRCVASERRTQLFMIKLAVLKKIVNIIMQNVRGTQFCVSLRSGNTLPKHKWGYFTLCKMLLLSGCRCSPRPIISLAIYIQHETNCTCQQEDLALLEFFPCAILFSQSLINADIVSYTSMVLILKCYLLLSKTNTKTWSKVQRKEYGSFVAKILFLQVDHGFLL